MKTEGSVKELVVATKNEGKLREIRDFLQDLEVSILSLRDFPPFPPLKEDGKTFRENALKKARATARRTNRLTIADDSGLEVDALGGKPGVLSARFAGDGAADAENNRKLLQLLEGVEPPHRGASFRCVIAVVDVEGREALVEAECRGTMALSERGSNGFGYDPLFIVPELGKTLAELSLDQKNRVSHRGKALAALQDVLQDFL